MSGVQKILVGPDEAEQRLDRWVRRRFTDFSQSQIERLCRKGQIRVDGSRTKPNTRVSPGQTIRIPPFKSHSFDGKARGKGVSATDQEMIKNCVIYKDESIIVLNKPSGLPVQGGSRQVRHVDGMTAALSFERDERPRLVHRLDKDTSGVLILARTQATASKLTEAFRHKNTRKLYWALVAGVPYPKIGSIKYGLVKARAHGKDGSGEKMYCVHPDKLKMIEGAKRAHTNYATLCFLAQRAAWMALVPITGRTHQLRAHMSELGHPIVGDGKYGNSSQDNQGDGWGSALGDDISKKMHLHARSLKIRHPVTGKEITFSAPLPDHMEKTWTYFGWTESDVPADPFEVTEEWL